MRCNGVKLTKFIQTFGLEVVNQGSDFDTAQLTIYFCMTSRRW